MVLTADELTKKMSVNLKTQKQVLIHEPQRKKTKEGREEESEGGGRRWEKRKKKNNKTNNYKNSLYLLRELFNNSKQYIYMELNSEEEEKIFEKTMAKML